MKTTRQMLSLITGITLLVAGAAIAEHKHDHAAEKAPHNGRLMETEKVGSMHVEFLVETDKSVSVYLYDGKLKAIAPSDQALTLIVQGKDDAKTTVELAKKEDRFVSAAAVSIPDGAKAILTIKTGGKTENLRFPLDMSSCGGCKKPEYACSCDH